MDLPDHIIKLLEESEHNIAIHSTEESIQDCFERAVRRILDWYDYKSMPHLIAGESSYIARQLDLYRFEDSFRVLNRYFEDHCGISLCDFPDSITGMYPVLRMVNNNLVISSFNTETSKRTTKKLTTFLAAVVGASKSSDMDKLVDGFLKGSLSTKGLSLIIHEDNLDSIIVDLASDYNLSSCMSHPAMHYMGTINPYAVYNNTDIGLAVIMEFDKPIGRCLVHKPSMSYSRIYSSKEAKVKRYLKSLGYTSNDCAFIGTNLNRIEINGGVVVPYLDLDVSLEDAGTHLEIVDDGDGHLETGSTLGMAFPDGETNCACCGEVYYLSDVVSTGISGAGTCLCDSCFEEEGSSIYHNGKYQEDSYRNRLVGAYGGKTVRISGKKYWAGAEGIYKQGGTWYAEWRHPKGSVPAKEAEADCRLLDKGYALYL